MSKAMVTTTGIGAPSGAGAGSLPAFAEPESLAGAAAAINELGRNLAEHAYLVGRHLLWVKERVGHGAFGGWVAENVWFSARTAQRFMRFATDCEAGSRLLDYAPGRSDTMTHLGEESDFGELSDVLIDALDRLLSILCQPRNVVTASRALDNMASTHKLMTAWVRAAERELVTGDLLALVAVRDNAWEVENRWAEFRVRCERRIGQCLRTVAEV